MLEQRLSPTQNTAAAGVLGAQATSQAASAAGERQSLPKAGVFSGLFASLLKRDETPSAGVAKGIPAVTAAPAALLAGSQGAGLTGTPAAPTALKDLALPAAALHEKTLPGAISVVLNPTLAADASLEATAALPTDLVELTDLAALPQHSEAVTAPLMPSGLSEKITGHLADPQQSGLSVGVEDSPAKAFIKGVAADTALGSEKALKAPRTALVEGELPVQAKGVANGVAHGLANGLPQAALENRQAGVKLAAKGASVSSGAVDERVTPQTLEIKASLGAEKVEEPGADLLKSSAFAQKPASQSQAAFSKPAPETVIAEAATLPGADKTPALASTTLENTASAVADRVDAEVTHADVKVAVVSKAEVSNAQMTNADVTGMAVSDELVSNTVLAEGEPLKAQVSSPAQATPVEAPQQALERAEFVHKPGAVLTQAESGHARQVELPPAAASRASSAFDATSSPQAGSSSQTGAQSGQGSHGQSAGQQSQGQATQQQFMQMAQTVAQEVQANRQQNGFNQQLAQKLETAQGVQSDSPLLEESLSALTTSERRGQLPQGLQSIGLPVAHPRWGQALGQRVVYMANNQVQQAQITLNPDKLGPVQIKLQLDKEQQVHVTMTAQHGVTREAMEAAMPRLKELMEQAGVDLGSVNVSQEQREFAQQDEQAGSGSGSREGLKGTHAEGDVTDTPATQVYATDNLVDYYA